MTEPKPPGGTLLVASLPSTLLWRWGVMNTNRPGGPRLWQRAPRHPGPHGNDYSSPIPTDLPRPNPSAAGQNLRKKAMALNLSHGSAQSQGGGWEWKQVDGCGLPCA